MSVACLDFSIIKHRKCVVSTTLYIPNGKHINKRIATFQMISKVKCKGISYSMIHNKVKCTKIGQNNPILVFSSLAGQTHTRGLARETRFSVYSDSFQRH